MRAQGFPVHRGLLVGDLHNARAMELAGNSCSAYVISAAITALFIKADWGAMIICSGPTDGSAASESGEEGELSLIHISEPTRLALI
eukprot:1330711-Alexandrium_andersonii.AAC.1